MSNTSPATPHTKVEQRYSQHQQGTPSPPSARKAEHSAQGMVPSRVNALCCICLALHLLFNKAGAKQRKTTPVNIHLNICSSSQAMSEGILASFHK